MNAIWLNETEYPSFQDSTEGNYFVARFVKSVPTEKGTHLTIKSCADTSYVLKINGKIIRQGPAYLGGDYHNPHLSTPCYRGVSRTYYDVTEYDTESDVLKIEADVTAGATELCEIALGRPFFALQIDGVLETDETFLSQVLFSHPHKNEYDFTAKEGNLCPSQTVKIPCDILPSSLEKSDEWEIIPNGFAPLTIASNQSVSFDFDKIYAGRIGFLASGDGRLRVTTAEQDDIGIFTEQITFDGRCDFFSPRLRAIGTVILTNEGTQPIVLEKIYQRATQYPVKNEGRFTCSNPLINRIFDVCYHTLKICRQSTHLDSPTHKEPLGCTGDYLIQSEMEYMNCLDATLTKSDIQKTLDFLTLQNGETFHTTYGLMVPDWIWSYYMHTDDFVLLKEAKKPLTLLFDFFEKHLTKDGVLETDDYMFLDWVEIDGYTLHHPPKALGQSALCMFYYRALTVMERIFARLGSNDSLTFHKRAEQMKASIRTIFYDAQKGLYLGGQNTPCVPNEWQPKNTDKKYYLKQSNVLAVLFGIAPKEERERILTYVVTDLKKEEMQPYFYSFLWEALLQEGLFERYGMDLILRYESLLQKSEKGLCEAWETFHGDCSHAWAGAPIFILKKALSGFEMIEPNYRTVSLHPSLCGLDFADFSIPTPYGDIEIKGQKGHDFIVRVPKEITVK